MKPTQNLVNEQLSLFIRVPGMNDIFALLEQTSDFIEAFLWRGILVLCIRLLNLEAPVIEIDGEKTDVLAVLIALVVILRLLQLQ